MRNVLLAALTLSSLVPLRDAAACGSYRPEPVVYRLSSHYVIDRDPTTERQRTFALVPERAPAKLAWRQLSPMSYDNTAIAMGTPFANPVTLTLVGPSGTRVVSSKQHVFLSRSWDFTGDTGAIEVPDHGDFVIALSGVHTDAKWHPLDETTDVETITTFPENSTKVITTVRRGGQTLGQFEGSALGTFELDGVTKLVIADGANVRTVAMIVPTASR